ncbi:uncharacterized protein METZ01_LOCUS263975, partial [marine metagenome]
KKGSSLASFPPTNSSQSDTPPSKIPNSCNIQEMMVMSDSAKPTN